MALFIHAVVCSPDCQPGWRPPCSGLSQPSGSCSNVDALAEEATVLDAGLCVASQRADKASWDCYHMRSDLLTHGLAYDYGFGQSKHLGSWKKGNRLIDPPFPSMTFPEGQVIGV